MTCHLKYLCSIAFSGFPVVVEPFLKGVTSKYHLILHGFKLGSVQKNQIEQRLEFIINIMQNLL